MTRPGMSNAFHKARTSAMARKQMLR